MDPILARSACIVSHRLAWLFYTLVFDLVFDIDFPPSWSDFGSQLGPILSNFSVLSWWSILKSICNRFFIDSSPPWHIQNWAAAYTGIKFSSFSTSYLKLPFGFHFGIQKPSKIEPKMLQNNSWFFHQLGSGFWSQLGSNSTWRSKKGPRVDFLQLNTFFRWWKSGPDFHHAILGPKALRDRCFHNIFIDFLYFSNRFLVHFWSILDPCFHCWLVAWVSCFNWLV